MQHLQPNTTLQGGKYRIERVLGQGGFGITYLARNTVFDVNVAIKEFFMKDENGRDGNTVTMPNTTKSELFNGQKEKFKKEAKRMFAIKNEHIIGVHDLFEENGTAYYVMDYIDGESLAERMKRTGNPMTENEVNNILPQILDALKVIHDNGIWHLDLKPANIMMDKAGNIKLIDFGASKQMNTQKGGATTSTAISYTNGYAPREQMEQNYDKFGPWTDIYALGATLYNLLTNKRPPLPSDIDDDHSEDKHVALPFSNISKGTKLLVIQMMNTDRMKRPQRIQDIKLLNYAGGNKKDDDSQNNPDVIISGSEETLVPSSPIREAQQTSNQESKVTPKSKYRRNPVYKKGWIWGLLLITFFAAVLMTGRKCNSSNHPYLPVEDSVVIDSTSIDIDSIDTSVVNIVVPNTQIEKDYISEEILENTKKAYKKQMNDFSKVDENNNCYYFLYDITEDKIPELWVVAGTCEADRMLYVYTYNDRLKKIYETGASHSVFYLGKNYVLQQEAHMGYANWNKIYIVNGEFQEKEIYQEEKPEGDYKEPKEQYAAQFSLDNFLPINSIK